MMTGRVDGDEPRGRLHAIATMLTRGGDQTPKKRDSHNVGNRAA